VRCACSADSVYYTTLLELFCVLFYIFTMVVYLNALSLDVSTGKLQNGYSLVDQPMTVMLCKEILKQTRTFSLALKHQYGPREHARQLLSIASASNDLQPYR
jgi:hypothetical protein